jgi:hypothetical protein
MFKSMMLLVMSILALTFVSGCYSFSSHQTAEVLDKDQVEWGEGFGYYMFDYTVDTYDENNNVSGTKNETFSLPYVPETIFRFGITDNMDAGIKLAGIFANIEADVKFQLLQVGDKVSNFTLSVQPSISGLVFGDISMYKFGAGLLASKRINSRVVFYGNIKYNYLMVTVDENSTDTGSDAFGDGSLYTTALGFSFEGKKWWIRPEVTVTLNEKFEKLFILPAVGFGLKF